MRDGITRHILEDLDYWGQETVGIEECDIPKMPSMAKTEMKKIGFAISA